ncbi:MAG: porin [Pelagimonas sp.]|jgi:outer membrane protein OmpU|nr:porin [Pelagimonas sp.]
MKKILIASTALVALAGAAHADITLTGGANFGMKYDDSRATNKAQIDNELDFNIVATGESDNGISFGASLDIDGDQTEATQGSTASVSDPEAFISFSGLTLTVGQVGSADVGGIADVGYDGIGIDQEMNDQGKHDVNIAYTTNGFTFQVSYGSVTEDYAVAVEGAFDKVTFALGHTVEKTADSKKNKDEVTHATLGYNFGSVATNVYVASVKTNNAKAQTNYGLDVSYTMNDLTLTLAAMGGDFQKDTNVGIGAKYNLGGGLAIAGGIGQVQDTRAGFTNKTKTVADLGVTMSF